MDFPPVCPFGNADFARNYGLLGHLKGNICFKGLMAEQKKACILRPHPSQYTCTLICSPEVVVRRP